MEQKNFNSKIIGKNVKEKRNQIHLTQAQLAELIDRTEVHVSHIENGSANMSMTVLYSLCNIFFCTPNDILLSASYRGESYGNLFLEYGLEPKDHQLIENLTRVFLQQRREEQSNPHPDGTEK